MTKTAEQADLVLPTLGYVEKGGSFLNIEGRVQKLKPGKAIPKRVYADSYIFARIAQRLGLALVIDEPFLDALKEGAILKTPRPEKIEVATTPKAIEANLLYATFAQQLFDDGVRMKENTQLHQLEKQTSVRIHPSEASKRGLKEGDEVLISVPGKQLPAKVTLHEQVAKQTLVIPVGFDAIPVHELGPNLFNGMQVHIGKYQE